MTAIAGRSSSKTDAPIPVQTTTEITMASLMCKKFITGYFGGICQALCSHPFDLIKSRVQSGTYPNISTTIKETFTKEGPTAFYKGVGPPIAIAGVYNAVLFASNEGAKKFLIYCFGLDKTKPLPMQYIMIAGVMAAPTSVAVVSPADVIKIQLQLQKEAKGKAKYNGMFDCAVKLIKEEGVKSLGRGYFPTLATRAIGLPAYFAGNDIGRRWWKKSNPNSSDFTTSLVGGVWAACFYWTSAGPVDLIKTKVQGQKIPTKTAMDFTREIYRNSGIRGFYFGFGACMMRAIPANMSIFAGMDTGDRLLKKYANW